MSHYQKFFQGLVVESVLGAGFLHVVFSLLQGPLQVFQLGLETLQLALDLVGSSLVGVALFTDVSLNEVQHCRRGEEMVREEGRGEERGGDERRG